MMQPAALTEWHGMAYFESAAAEHEGGHVWLSSAATLCIGAVGL
jgi:hypothetical protein